MSDDYRPGLEGVIAGETAVGGVDQSVLHYRGYDVKELAEHSSFEEISFLLLTGELPTADQLAEVRSKLDSFRPLAAQVVDVVASIPPGVGSMDVLRTAVSMSDHFGPQTPDTLEGWIDRTWYLTAQITGIIAARQRLLSGSRPLPPKPGLSHAAQFLYQTRGGEPSEDAAKLIDLSLILYADHGYNASTFAGRVCASTLSDLASCIVVGISTLKGPLHGGANEEALKMLLQFKSAAQARQGTLDAINNKVKIMGFGHRVYKDGDHRARILEARMVKLAEAQGQRQWVDIYFAVKDTVMEQKGIHPNVDYPCGLVYYLLDLPIDVYTPLFVASRVIGWAAHATEQHFNNRIIRPRSRYIGPALRRYLPARQR